MVDTDVFLLHVDKYEVGDSTPGCMSHRFIRAVFMQRWTDPWSIGRVIPVKPWCTGKQLPLGFNPMDLGSVGGLYLETGLQSLAGPRILD